MPLDRNLVCKMLLWAMQKPFEKYVQMTSTWLPANKLSIRANKFVVVNFKFLKPYY